MDHPSAPVHSPPRLRMGKRGHESSGLSTGAPLPTGAENRLQEFLQRWGPTGVEPLAASQRTALLEIAAAALGASRLGLMVLGPDGAFHGEATAKVGAAPARHFRRTAVSLSELMSAREDRTQSPPPNGRYFTPSDPLSTSKLRLTTNSDPAVARRLLWIGSGPQSPPAVLVVEMSREAVTPDSESERMLATIVADRLVRVIKPTGSGDRGGARSKISGTSSERRLIRGLLEAGASMHQALSLDEVLQRIAVILGDAGGFEAVAIYILDAETQLLHPAAIVGVDPADVDRMQSTPVALADYRPMMLPSMRVGRSYLFDHRKHRMPTNTILDTALTVPELPADWHHGQWHPLDSLTIPLELSRGQLLGLISLDRPRDRHYPTPGTVGALELFADQCAAAISRAKLYRYMEELALTDSLTGLHNRHALEQTLAQDLARLERVWGPYSVLFCDLDDFKRVNDTFGHAVGDQILQQVAAILRQRLRRGDFAARCGGDEFVILLPDANTQQAGLVAEDIRQRVANTTAPCQITVSIGVASPARGGLDPRKVLDTADAAMYIAKRSGRDRVEWAKPEMEGTKKLAPTA